MYNPERIKRPHERAVTSFRCTTCEQVKAESEFYTYRYRRYEQCKKCLCEKAKQRLKQPESKARNIEKCRRYYSEKRSTLLAQKSEYGKRIEVAERDKARRRERYATDPAFKENTKRRRDRYYGANAHVFRARDARRRAEQLKATPQWADLAKIRALYLDAARLSEQTGERHEVDHIVPLKGRYVCGLHVENNLRVILGTENRKKFNRLVEDIV